MQDSHLLLLRHGDKAIAGAFAAWLVYALALPFFSGPATLKEREEIAQSLATVESHEANFEVSAEPMAQTLPGLRQNVDPSEVPPVDEFSSWMVHRRPSLTIDIVKPAPLPTPIHRPPTNVHVTKVEHHQTTLTWSPDSQNSLVKLTGYEILRQDKPGNPFLSVGSVSADRTEFVDGTTPSFATVVYRIRENAVLDTDDASLPKNMPPLTSEVAMTTVDSAPVTTPRDIYLSVEDGAAGDPLQAGLGAEAHATLRVFTWTNGKFVSKTIRDVRAGNTIGASGAVLKDVKVEKRAVKPSKIPIHRAVATIEWPNGLTEEIVWGEAPELK